MIKVLCTLRYKVNFSENICVSRSLTQCHFNYYVLSVVCLSSWIQKTQKMTSHNLFISRSPHTRLNDVWRLLERHGMVERESNNVCVIFAINLWPFQCGEVFHVWHHLWMLTLRHSTSEKDEHTKWLRSSAAWASVGSFAAYLCFATFISVSVRWAWFPVCLTANITQCNGNGPATLQ